MALKQRTLHGNASSYNSEKSLNKQLIASRQLSWSLLTGAGPSGRLANAPRRVSRGLNVLALRTTDRGVARTRPASSVHRQLPYLGFIKAAMVIHKLIRTVHVSLWMEECVQQPRREFPVVYFTVRQSTEVTTENYYLWSSWFGFQDSRSLIL